MSEYSTIKHRLTYEEKLKVKSGVFKGIEGYVTDVNYDKDGVTVFIKVDQLNIIQVPLSDIEQNVLQYIIYAKNDCGTIVKYFGQFELSPKQAELEVEKLHKQYKLCVSVSVIAVPVGELRLQIGDNKFIESAHENFINDLFKNKSE